jgi:hypothetical protein
MITGRDNGLQGGGINPYSTASPPVFRKRHRTYNIKIYLEPQGCTHLAMSVTKCRAATKIGTLTFCGGEPWRYQVTHWAASHARLLYAPPSHPAHLKNSPPPPVTKEPTTTQHQSAIMIAHTSKGSTCALTRSPHLIIRHGSARPVEQCGRLWAAVAVLGVKEAEVRAEVPLATNPAGPEGSAPPLREEDVEHALVAEPAQRDDDDEEEEEE